MRKGIHCLCGMILIASTCWSGLLAQSSSISISNLNTIDKVLYDTAAYDLDLFVINESLTQNFSSPVTIRLSVNGDDPTDLALNVTPPFEVVPGDSFLIHVPGYSFDPMRFSSGGGLAHDIIVWPMVIGSPPGDSIIKEVIFEFNPNHIAQSLSIVNPDFFPDHILKDNAYDFDLEVMNLDLTNPLYHPISIAMSIDGQPPIILKQDFGLTNVLNPGSSVNIPVQDYHFETALFGPGGRIVS